MTGHTLGQLLRALVGMILAGLTAHTWVAMGLVAPLVIHGDSMAPHWWGEHYAFPCTACSHTFRCSPRLDLDRDGLVCPNCHTTLGQPSPRAVQPGRRVVIDRASLAFRPIARWDLVALRDPRQPDRLWIKRVVGLPGETVDVRSGQVYVDERIAGKPWRVLQQMAIPVHCEPYTSRHGNGPPSHWTPAGPATGWRYRSGRWQYEATSTMSREGTDWLVYQPPLPPRVVAGLHHRGGVWDEYGYNQRLSRTLHPVADLILRVQMQVVGHGAVELVADQGHGVWRLQLGTDGGYRLLDEAQGAAKGRWQPPKAGAPWRIELACWDQKLAARSDGRSIVCVRLPRPSSPAPWPFRLAATGLKVVVHQLEIARDVYYIRPLGANPLPLPYPLQDDQYFVLGDNSPVSVDSRDRGCGPVDAGWILGRVVSWPWADERVSCPPGMGTRGDEQTEVSLASGFRYIPLNVRRVGP